MENLLKQYALKQYLNNLPKEWTNVINKYSSEIIYAIIDKIEYRLSKKIIIYPKNPLRIFFEIPSIKNIKIIIIGQDPYHSFGYADGLAFSASNILKTPQSLKNIFKELYLEYGFTNKSNDLISWVHQGVLLLNSILTVEDKKPGSHANYGWEYFTNNIIEYLAKDNKPKIFILWGKFAQSKKYLIEKYTNHLILTSNHPSPLSAYKKPNPFIGCNHFKKSNQWLYNHNITPIKWNI
ncbi:Uracil-DNA glycosylase [Candidatus Kinetoplastibacterium sorsogonicusi]|uniref:Uracil-DNA glycosylase n=1 Tax=Candidatus Kinetoplastidibacterium kentomonadis TaxID=1576550 RepID=A0A3Q8EYE9_9PROT|nr:uracil-DNA glycosylase [Candidatus Kinetoplastibacterium sorsogonicusi]AWD32743.1 Uracil-DNA glycosylase [Candidatus Kinetoplastibacterium sorsogonicusi]